MADRVSLSNMVFYAFHGAFDAERELGQRFEVDVDIYTDFRRAAHADDLDLALNYVHVYNIVKEIVEARPFNLLEAMAERIAGAIIDAFDVFEVTVRVRKPGAPVGGIIDYAEVEVTRPGTARRAGGGRTAGADDAGDVGDADARGADGGVGDGDVAGG